MLNISAQASVVVSTAAGPAIMLSPTPGTATILGTSNIQFQWSTGVDVTSYELLIGTSGVGSSNILNTGVIGTTSYTLPTLPYNGVTVYVRLGSLTSTERGRQRTTSTPRAWTFLWSTPPRTMRRDRPQTAPVRLRESALCATRLPRQTQITVSNITFAPTVFLATNSAAANTITLANGTLNIPSGATITGLTSGSGVTLTNLVTVSGNNATTVFTVASGVTGAVIANLNIINGNSANGGGINNAGTLTVTASSFNLNNAANSGGAIYSDGTMTVVDSSISRECEPGIRWRHLQRRHADRYGQHLLRQFRGQRRKRSRCRRRHLR